MTGPYIIETTRHAHIENTSITWSAHHTRLAVGTLEEAQDIAHQAGATFAAAAIRKDGGTIGPLPDGRTIEVKPTTYLQLAIDLGYPNGYPGELVDLLAAWNRAHNTETSTR